VFNFLYHVRVLKKVEGNTIKTSKNTEIKAVFKSFFIIIWFPTVCEYETCMMHLYLHLHV